MTARLRTPPLARPRLAVLLSGGGTTLQNFIDQIAVGSLAADIAVVIASRADAYGLERARLAAIPAVLIARKEFADIDAFNDALHAELARHDFDLLLMAGFLSPLQLRGRYTGRVLNIHPSLLPAFGGRGFYGEKVHQAVLDAGVKVSGCTVHFADDEYDRGPIVLQGTVPVMDEDTPATLAARVHAVENDLYPEAVRLWAGGRLQIEGRKVRLRPVAEATG